ncbi:MAG: hypothetical protein ACR2FS_10910 [Phormidesmis sp.]
MTSNLNLDLQASALQPLAAARASQPAHAAASRSYQPDLAIEPGYTPSSENVWQLTPPSSAPVQQHSNGDSLTADEKFDLLSAYLDDEVSEQERCLVEQWLSSDAQIQQQYQAQNKIRRALRAGRRSSPIGNRQ